MRCWSNYCVSNPSKVCSSSKTGCRWFMHLSYHTLIKIFIRHEWERTNKSTEQQTAIL